MSIVRFVSFIIEKKAQGGFDYEDRVNARLKDAGVQSASQKSAGSSADAPDGALSVGGKDHKLEIKQNKNSMMGQIELHHDGEKWVVSPNSKKKYPATTQHVETHFLPVINHPETGWGKPTGDYETDKGMGNRYQTIEGTQPIRDHYGKDRETPYIQIGKSGLHHTSEDAANLGTPELNGNTQFRSRFKYRGTDPKTGKKKYGALVVMGLKAHEKSNIDLDNDGHLQNLGK
jgi:hypothetical protein